jgi:SAM-dependent methyltransferase
MRVSFAHSVLGDLLVDGTLTRSDSILAVCAGERERDLFSGLGFADVVISNIDEQESAEGLPPFRWSHQDAQALTYGESYFDFSFVADGLHHCSSPHRAMLEMYRVARKGIVVIESRDSLLMRVANRFGLSPEYEVEAVIGSDFARGGVNDTSIPNYIYRWTETELMRTIKSFSPYGPPKFQFFYGLNLPYELAEWKKSKLKLRVIMIADPFIRGLTRVFKKQCNTLAMVALKPRIPDDLWPWLKLEGDEIVFDPVYADQHFEPIEGSRLSAHPRRSSR